MESTMHPLESTMHPSASAERPTHILKAEHEIILQALDCLERVAESAVSGVIDLASARDLLDFFAVFADRCHHAKEEECLFPRLIDHGLPRNAGPLAVMLAEHEEGRRAVSGMRAALQAFEQGGGEACRRFSAAARSYAELLRAHIEKENHVLFPMAEEMLDQEVERSVLEGFGRLETDLHQGTHERYVRMIESLAQRLGVEKRSPAPAHNGSCCAHGPARGAR
jgi:hemerythrin-like domain-containing protein